MYAISWLELKRRVAIELWRTGHRDEVLLSSKQLARFGNWLMSLPEEVRREFIESVNERVLADLGEFGLLGPQLLVLGEQLLSERLKVVLRNWDAREASALIDLAPTVLPARYRQCKVVVTQDDDGKWDLELDPSVSRLVQEASDCLDLVLTAQEALNQMEVVEGA
jgi:hypothetical protein